MSERMQKIFGSIYESVCYNYQIIKWSSLNILHALSTSLFKILLYRQWHDVSKVFQEKLTASHVYNKFLETDQKSYKEDQRFPYFNSVKIIIIAMDSDLS